LHHPGHHVVPFITVVGIVMQNGYQSPGYDADFTLRKHMTVSNQTWKHANRFESQIINLLMLQLGNWTTFFMIVGQKWTRRSRTGGKIVRAQILNLYFNPSFV
jgi:hypothetical protein